MCNFWWIAIVFGILCVGLVIFTIIDRFCLKTGWHEVSSILSIACVFVFIAFAIAGSVVPLEGKKEYENFVNTAEMVERIYEDDSTLENAGLTAKVIELNTWLVNARADKAAYGNWSKYCYCNLDELEFIHLQKPVQGEENSNGI